jgi:uncharacterized protein
MSETLLEFPCDFPIKVMGRSETDFVAEVVAVVAGHAGPLPAERVRTRPSREGNFVSVTLTVRVESQAQLDGIYTALSAHERVLMVL